MLLVIDSGNTRTKWALVNRAGETQLAEVCVNADLDVSSLSQDAKKASKVIIANVAGDLAAQKLMQLLAPLDTHFIVAKKQAAYVINHYEQVDKLGADRWASLIAAWHINQQATLVINAGTAITMDCVINSEQENIGLFLGGTIMPGLRLMQTSLVNNTAQLNIIGEASYITFPTNTQNAMQTGCLNAAVGAIIMQWQYLKKHSDLAPKIIISGGDATTIANALTPFLNVNEKQAVIVENLVLQGLVILEKEY